MDLNTYIVGYDIMDPKRLAAVHRKMKGFGDPIQYSIFKCSLSQVNLQYMMIRLEAIIDKQEDRVMIIDLGPTEGQWKKRVTFLGQAIDLDQEQVFIF